MRKLSAAQRRKWWPRVKRGLTLAFFLLVTALVVQGARAVDWDEVGQALRSYQASTLWAAAALAAASLLVYSCYDLIGRLYTGHKLPAPRVMAVAVVSYTFNLNFGSWVGGIAFRYRLYSRAGLKVALITRVLGLSLVTNWLGYMALAGVVFAAGSIELPQHWPIGSALLRLIGVALLAAVAAYLLSCALLRRRTWKLRGHAVQLPALRIALMQLVISVANWLLISSILYVLLKQEVAFPMVVATLLISGIAGAAMHIPAGLGVIEAVFLALLGGQLGEAQILGALFAYRGLYYIGPLLGGLVLYAALEMRGRPRRQGAPGLQPG